MPPSQANQIVFKVQRPVKPTYSVSRSLRILERLRLAGLKLQRDIDNADEYDNIVFADENENVSALDTTMIAETDSECTGAKVVENYRFFDSALLESFMQCAGVSALHCSDCPCNLCKRD